ncbi:DUF805 domain-containing protein [Aquicoccus porphyridii]|uniref:DUF805 domain-containing protein n=1 Tax=Aquicoccus porphyridii TaxID=1852029 RepID=UPI00273EDE10|nr:DUF805 domain-containing protein [Aquicoccus porphyridii]
MDFQTSVKTCLTQKYARFEGRASRPEYWWFILAYVIGLVLFALLGIKLLYVLFVLAMIVPVTAAGWRRLQDTGRPGWYILIPVVIGGISMLVAPQMPQGGFGGGAMMGGDFNSGPGNMGRMGASALLGIVQLVLLVIYAWWLSRPSQPETNDYGPKPQN